MGQILHKQGERFTYGDYLTWPGEEHWELIDGADNLLTVRLLGEDGKYGIPLIREGKGRISSAILPEMEILLDAVFAA